MSDRQPFHDTGVSLTEGGNRLSPIERPHFLSTLPAKARDRRIALVMMAVSVLIFAIFAPFAKTPLKPLWVFIPIYETLLVVNDLFTALLLYGLFAILRERSLAILASGYLFTGVMAAFHALTFPGLFAPGGLLGADTQTAAWLYIFWHMGFPLFVIAYALLKGRRLDPLPEARSRGRYIALCMACTILLACGLMLLTTAGHDLLPVLVEADGYTMVMHFVASSVWVASLAALVMLFLNRSSSVLDLWLTVVVFAWLIDISLSVQINAARFDLGFYAGRIYGAIAASFVLARLLFENTGLYAQLGTTHSRLAAQNRELQYEIGVRIATEKALRRVQAELTTHHGQLEDLVVERTAELEEANYLLAKDIAERKRIETELRRSEQKFRLLYENAPIGIAHINLEGRWTYANRKFGEITGYAPDELVGLSYLDVTPPEERATSTQLTDKLLAGEIEILGEQRMLRKDGSTSWICLTARMLRDESGRPQYGIAIFEDINEKKRAQAALQDSEERFRTTFENAPVGIVETTFDGVLINANPKMLEMLGYTLEEFRHLPYTGMIHPADIEQTNADFQSLVSGQATSYVAERRYIRKDGSFIWIKITTAMRHANGVPTYVIGIVEDITARKRAEEDLRRALERSYHLATHDALTGLANRASFKDRLQEALNYAKRDEHLVAVHLLDLDRFKSINDTFGHHIGDLLLKEVANRINAQTRSTDIVARLGGDEFVILQTHLAAPYAAGVLAGKIVDELGRTFILEGQEVNSGTSIGIALFPDDAHDGEQLVKLADLALYEAKSRGRYNYQFYRHEMGAAVDVAQQLEDELRVALKDGQFRLHYQPQFDLKSGHISGIEVLLRWQHPEKGLLPAAEFIYNAENAGLMPSIGEWTLRTACSRHKKWMDIGLAVPLILNVSLRELRHPRFLQTLKDILEETAVPLSMIQLEAAESALWDPKLSMSLLKEAKDIGIRLAVDNFGTELAALSSLYRFPLDVVKPSRNLVKEVPHRKQEASVLAAVVSVAHERKIAVCAEGIETQEQLDAVKQHGCDAGQGNLLSAPLSESEMDRLVETGVHIDV